MKRGRGRPAKGGVVDNRKEPSVAEIRSIFRDLKKKIKKDITFQYKLKSFF